MSDTTGTIAMVAIIGIVVVLAHLIAFAVGRVKAHRRADDLEARDRAEALHIQLHSALGAVAEPTRPKPSEPTTVLKRHRFSAVFGSQRVDCSSVRFELGAGKITIERAGYGLNPGLKAAGDARFQSFDDLLDQAEVALVVPEHYRIYIAIEDEDRKPARILEVSADAADVTIEVDDLDIQSNAAWMERLILRGATVDVFVASGAEDTAIEEIRRMRDERDKRGTVVAAAIDQATRSAGSHARTLSLDTLGFAPPKNPPKQAARSK